MTTNQTTNEDDVLDEKLKNLSDKIDLATKQLDVSSEKTSNILTKINDEVDQNIKEIDKGLEELYLDEQETENDMEGLMLEEAENIAKDDELDNVEIKDEEDKEE